MIHTLAMAAPKMDFIAKDACHYLVTLAPKDWFTQEQYAPIKLWFSKHDQVLGYEETEGKRHLHVLLSSTQKKTGNVTRALENLFTTHDIPWAKNVTIDVRRSVEPIGHFHYLTNESKGGTQVMIKGWTLTWIQQQCRDNLKKLPRKLLRKDVYVVNNIDGPKLIIDYADCHAMPLTDKFSFIEVVRRMAGDKYRFHTCKKKDLFVDVLAVCGETRYARSLWENELAFIET